MLVQSLLELPPLGSDYCNPLRACALRVKYVMVCNRMQKLVPLVQQNVMKLEVFILGGQRIDQKRKRDGGGEGEERELRKGAERG